MKGRHGETASQRHDKIRAVIPEMQQRNNAMPHMAEREGFEPPIRVYRITVFKTVSFGRSDNAPIRKHRQSL